MFPLYEILHKRTVYYSSKHHLLSLYSFTALMTILHPKKLHTFTEERLCAILVCSVYGHCSGLVISTSAGTLCTNIIAFCQPLQQVINLMLFII